MVHSTRALAGLPKACRTPARSSRSRCPRREPRDASEFEPRETRRGRAASRPASNLSRPSPATTLRNWIDFGGRRRNSASSAIRLARSPVQIARSPVQVARSPVRSTGQPTVSTSRSGRYRSHAPTVSSTSSAAQSTPAWPAAPAPVARRACRAPAASSVLPAPRRRSPRPAGARRRARPSASRSSSTACPRPARAARKKPRPSPRRRSARPRIRPARAAAPQVGRPLSCRRSSLIRSWAVSRCGLIATAASKLRKAAAGSSIAS
jgi:hypothetical protein